MNTLSHYCKIILNIIIPVIALVLLLWVGPKFLVFFSPFVIGYILALVANPLVALLTNKLKIKRKAVSVVVIILVLAIIVFASYGIGSLIARQLIGFIGDLPSMLNSVEAELQSAGAHFVNLFEKLPSELRSNFNQFGTSFRDYISAVVSSISKPTVSALGNAAKHIPNFFISLIMCFLSSYFFIAEREYLNSFIRNKFPKGLLYEWDLVCKSLKKSVGGYFKAQLKIELWMYLLLVIGLSVANINYAALVAFGIACLDLFPILGTGTVLIPWAIIKFLSGDYVSSIILIALWGGGQLLRQIIQPKIMGDSLGIAPIPTLFLLYAGWKLDGVLGMILALPLAIIIVNLNEAGLFDQAKDSVRYLIRDVNKFRKFTKEDEDFDQYRK